MKLKRVQNTSARLITRTGKHEHIQPILFDLHWLPVVYRVQYKLCKYVYKALHNLAPTYLAELVCEHKPTRSLRSESANQLVVPRVQAKTYGDRRVDRHVFYIFRFGVLILINFNPINVVLAVLCKLHVVLFYYAFLTYSVKRFRVLLKIKRFINITIIYYYLL